jgi:hypothetical protein
MITQFGCHRPSALAAFRSKGSTARRWHSTAIKPSDGWGYAAQVNGLGTGVTGDRDGWRESPSRPRSNWSCCVRTAPPAVDIHPVDSGYDRVCAAGTIILLISIGAIEFGRSIDLTSQLVNAVRDSTRMANKNIHADLRGSARISRGRQLTALHGLV